jgi:cyclic beta-1,2-glucan synthetase
MAQPALLQLLPTLTPPLAALLDARRGPLAPPIRGEIFGAQRFEQHGRNLGLTHRAARAGWRAPTFSPRLNDNIAVLREAQRSIGLHATRGYDLSPAAEWLLDNFHLIEAQLQEIHEGLPRRYFRSLPLLQDAPLAGLPRVYGLAWAFVAHTDGAFDEDLLVTFLTSYQQTRDLSLGELWALPTTLRIVLIESLRRLAERVATNKAAREAANLCCDAGAAMPVERLQRLLDLAEQRGVAPVFLAQMALRLQEPPALDGDDPLLAQRAWLSITLPQAASAQAQHSVDQAADNLSVSNALTALREIGAADWADIVARGSALMQRLLAAPSFAAEHTTTQGESLHAIEALARRSRRSEMVVATQLLDCMRRGDGPEAGTAGYWLSGSGWPQLRRALALHDGPALAWAPWPQRGLPLVYLAALLAGTVALAAWASGGGSGPWAALVFALACLPASETVLAVMHRLIGESVRPHALPRLALAEGIPPSERVLVVVPALLTDATTLQALVHRLLLHHLANAEPQAQLALLTDWTDATSASRDDDAALLALAVAQVEALNTLHGHGGDGPPRFLLLHRVRRFSVSEQAWIGWERKRGKLEQLMALLATGDSTDFVDLGPLSRPWPDIRHVLTLDSDTQLPPGQLRALVGVAAHPRNRPRLNTAGRAVVAGFGILQPRVVTPLPQPGRRTPFHWLFAGRCGIDPYSAASSEVYQDLFGAGSFSGKGLIDVAAMHAVLGGRLPPDRVLSHDLLEGALLRCAAVSDQVLIEDAPADADVAAARAHRWMRGDWQLLPFLAEPGLRLLDRWKMLDNLRRSLLAPASLALLLLALVAGAGAPGPLLLLVFAAGAAGPLMGALAGLLPDRVDIARRHFFQAAGADFGRAVGTGLWHVALLPRSALLALDAVGRTLHRLLRSRRHLLAWTTAASAAARGSMSLPAQWRQQANTVLPALALAVLAAGWGRTPAVQVIGAVLGLLWAGTPLWTWWASRPLARRDAVALSAADRAWMTTLARDTWSFFERCVGPDDRHLPPDNLQTEPHDAVAHRTSPTNIGMYLLSAACARRFGWITPAQLATRLEDTLQTLDGLATHRGHFLNWYDTQTGEPLLPMYVSTVDSGNLCGHLLAVAAACREVDATPGQAPVDAPTQVRLDALASRCETLAWAPAWGFLYHRKRQLLHIGYRVADQQLDTSCYDLLASESRLTSLIAIARGDVPVRHWAALGRPSVAVGATAGLRSWSGSMFEYLMPGLVLDEPAGSVLEQANRAAVAEQRAYGAEQQLPWGISECAHAARDHTLAYQYAPQGVPALALRRTPPDELVVAPYASAMACTVALAPALANLRALAVLGARGSHGFIEALDYSPARQTLGSSVTRVSTFMAHHQGMSLVALAQVLLDGAPRRWGMAAPQLEALAPLLHERPPRQISRRRAPWGAPAALALAPRSSVRRREVWPGATGLAPTHVLSNGGYSVTLRANGAGESRWRGRGLSRWRDDALRDHHGSFMYLRRSPAGPLVSLTQHPAPDGHAEYRSVFHADRVCFEAQWTELHAQTTVWVSPEDDIEFREVTLRNSGPLSLALTLVSSFEPTLVDARADEAHPAFSNLFLRARWRAEHQALVFERRPRLAGEPALWAAHFLAGSDTPLLGLQLQTDRARWAGRQRAADHPLGELQDPPTGSDPLGEALDTGLDPVSALAVRVRIPAGGKVVLTFATAASDDGGVLSAVIDKYRQPSHVQRASLMSATLADIRLRGLGVSAETFAAVQLLTTALLFTLTRGPQRPSNPATAGVDRRELWGLGLSGERALLLVSVRTPQDVGLLRALAQALRIWAWGGVACDLVVVSHEPLSYQTALQQALNLLPDPGQNLHRLRADELSPATWRALRRLARVHLQADGRPLAHHVQDWAEQHEQAVDRRHAVSAAGVGFAAVEDRPARTPVGRFDAGTGSFSFGVDGHTRPPRPWVNVLANPGFGSIVTDCGGGHTWAGNSRMHQLTAWGNDPVADVPAEWFLLQDLRSGETWSLAPSAWGDLRVPYQVQHGPGETVISHRRGALGVRATWCVDVHTAVKQVTVQLTHHGQRPMTLRVVGLVEWMLGEKRSDRASVLTSAARAGEHTALLATQAEQATGSGGMTAFLTLKSPAAAAASGPAGLSGLAGASDGPEAQEQPLDTSDWTCDRREFFDARGRLVLPDHLGQGQGPGLDPCAALATTVRLAPGAVLDVVFLLGHAGDRESALALVQASLALPAAERLQAVRAHWDELLGATTVLTPDPLFDVMVNRWLLYQAVACRLWAKAGFYQAGGATGFRDQLQDTLALAWAAPGLLRAQILRCAGRQYPEGDVQHWWHEPAGAGVRTHVSDDLLWLPLACARYLAATGDGSLLDEALPFLDGGAIPTGAEDLYETPRIGTALASVYEHAARTLDRSLRSGSHGLPLMGGGDWNDGMNRVGHEGRGESVWLAWFLISVVRQFAPLAQARGDGARAATWETAAVGWQQALEDAGWDGAWYRRAFFDDGSALGSAANSEARIDLIAQAWSVLSDAAPPAHQRAAMDAVQQHLVDERLGLLRLLDPPLAQALPSAGYIQAYPPGVRENGGQYSHAGVWALMAQARLAQGAQARAGDRDTVYRWFTGLSPAHRSAHAERGPLYGLEPYAVAGDVYSQPPHAGRGGWSWYTGAAAWLHRAAVESMFGLQQGAQTLSFQPCLPTHWPRAELTLRRGGRSVHVLFLQPGTPHTHAPADTPDGTDAKPLQPGEPLAWSGLPAHSRFVMRLLPEPG